MVDSILLSASELFIFIQRLNYKAVESARDNGVQAAPIHYLASHHRTNQMDERECISHKYNVDPTSRSAYQLNKVLRKGNCNITNLVILVCGEDRSDIQPF